MRIWLDDLRPMPPGYDVHVCTAPEVIEYLKSGKVTRISLDHDLGECNVEGVAPGTGYDVAAWIEEQAYNGKLAKVEWSLHSANPVGRRNMELALQNADRFWRDHTDNPEKSMSSKKALVYKGATYIPVVAYSKEEELLDNIAHIFHTLKRNLGETDFSVPDLPKEYDDQRDEINKDAKDDALEMLDKGGKALAQLAKLVLSKEQN